MTYLTRPLLKLGVFGGGLLLLSFQQPIKTPRTEGEINVAQSSHTLTNLTSDLLDRQEKQIWTTALISLLPIVVAFSFIVFLFYRNKREAYFRQKEAELKLAMAEMEIKALRAQINPHFIFNCLNSIHHYMHKHDIKRAGDYLLKFSQLIRLILENSV